jgi:hypothetical protein
MFDQTELAETLDLHHKSYELLRWVSRNLRNNTLDFTTAHEAVSNVEAAQEWILRHWHNLPAKIRPLERQLDAFAHLFTSYLTTSFKLVENPGPQVRSYCGCYCRWCTYLGQANRLQVNSPSKGAKRTAEELKRVYLTTLATHEARTLTIRQVDSLIANTDLRESLAIATYSHELIRRTRFASQGEGVLALWRQFAWDKSGMKPGFRFDLGTVLAAESSVVSHMRAI